MYLHIGNDIVIPFKDVIAVLDLRTTGKAPATKEFFKKFSYGNNDKNRDMNFDNLKSCIVTRTNIYYSTISSSTLQKRINSVVFEK